MRGPGGRPLLVAQGGASGHSRADGAEAFLLALRLGAGAVSSALWITADGVPVVGGDGRVRRRRRRVEVADATLEECQVQGQMSLADLISLLAGRPLLAEVGNAGAVDPAVEVARGLGREDALWLVHPDTAALAVWRDSHPALRLLNRARLGQMRQGPERRAAELSALGIDALIMPHDDWSGGLVALFGRFGRQCVAFDAQHERIILSLARMGLDAIGGDYVDRLVDATGSVAPTTSSD
ncbi:MAG: hypothetical protein ACT4OS_07790 [Acidimicrobiales bacterium]